MALGVAKTQARFEDPGQLLGDRLRGIYRFLADFGGRLFPDDYFADMYKESRRGRPTVPARVLATVMILQAHEGLSDQEAVDRLECDLRWQAAAGVPSGCEGFHATVLVGMRNRLRASERPRRLFEDTKRVAGEAGVMGVRARVLDSTPLFDAVATQDTVTQLRAGIRKLLMLLQGLNLGAKVRLALQRADDYVSLGKPPCDWGDPGARDELVDALVRDVKIAVEVMAGQKCSQAVAEVVALLAELAGQDIETAADGTFRIARAVAKNRIISTVDVQARHGHKSHDRRFDGYKTHLSIDPDSELIDETAVTAANVADHEAVDDLLAPVAQMPEKPDVYGDSAYADAENLSHLEDQGFTVMAKVPAAHARDGRYSKDEFGIDLEAETVTCPAGQVAPIRWGRDGDGLASFGPACSSCPLAEQCTTNASGRTISIHPHEQTLQNHKAEQQTAHWQQAYTATRPTVERKIAHFVSRVWGGRKARTRGKDRIATDVDSRAAALNWSRLDVLGVHWNGATWAAAGP
jgi:IS5 family transposase